MVLPCSIVGQKQLCTDIPPDRDYIGLRNPQFTVLIVRVGVSESVDRAHGLGTAFLDQFWSSSCLCTAEVARLVVDSFVDSRA